MKKLFTFLIMLTALVSMNAQEENVYILGNVGDQQWDPSVGTLMEYNDGMYEYEGHFNAASYFSFTTQLAESSSDWDGIAPYRFGASSDGYIIDENNLGEYIQCGEIEESKNNAFCFPVAGTYHIYLELEERIMLVERISVDVEPDPVDEGDIYILGNFIGNYWGPNSGLKMTRGEDGDGIFTAKIHVADNACFSFTHALAQSASNWAGIEPFRFACADEDPTVVLGEVMHVTEDGVGDPVFSIEAPGYYLLTLNMNDRTLVVTEAEKEEGIFIIGNEPFGNWHPESAVKMEQNGDIFTYEAEINGDVWFIFSGDYGTWDAVNALRYGPLEENEDVVIGQEMTTQLSENTNASYKISGNGTYTITFDRANLTFIFEDYGSFSYKGINYSINSFDATTVTVVGCKSDLKQAIIPEQVTYEGLTYTVTDIAQNAFNNCSSLKVISIPATVTSIGSGAFRGCSLDELSIYADIEEGNSAFNNCSVNTLYVAGNVTKLKGTKLNPTSIYCFGSTPAVCDNNTFKTYNAALHVPATAMTDYFLADIWCNFNNISGDAGAQPQSLSLDVDEVTLELGETLQLNATVNPTSVVPVRWMSSDENVVMVSDGGLLTARAAGEATVTASCMGLLQECQVTVQDEQVVATISEHQLTLERGNVAYLTATTSPIEAAVIWTSTNTNVASVAYNNGRAVVTAINPGEALIIATPEGDNVKPDTCRVTVTEITVIVTLDKHELTLKRTQTAYLTATTSPIEAAVIWSSTNTDVALVRVVNGRALVLGNLPGEAMIVATVEGDLVQSDSCRVTVIRPFGDANNDGLVDVSDVNHIINIILHKVEETEDGAYTDLNEDGNIDVADVNIVINIILGKINSDITTYTVNGVSFKMVGVEGGTFTMGGTSEQGSDAYDCEKPAHQVTLSSYSIGRTEVTQELWLAVMGSNPSWFNGTGNSSVGSSHSENYGTNLQRPVESVSWDDCQEFINTLNQLTGKNFRLPTEAEWEYAARGGSRSQGYKYSGSNTIDDVAWYWGSIPSHSDGTAGYATQTVGAKAPNELGLYDMSGNVNEWCSDRWGHYSNGAQVNPTGPTSGIYRVMRGGGWSDGARNCRVSDRVRSPSPDRRDFALGLRLAH